MAEQLKLWYNELLIDKISIAIKQEYSNFNTNSFKVRILNENWEDLELKERMHRITECIHSHLPFAYNLQINILNNVAPKFNGLTAIIFPNFVEKYGLDYFDISIQALEDYTTYSTSEFAIRPFIVNYPNKTMKKMLGWANHKNHHIRRLASEGCRPLLPWALKLRGFVNDPSPILPILHILKADHEDYVYRSVANNLNDISKHHPQLVIDICTNWLKTNNKNTQWLVKHALRTLLKKGNQDAMKLFGFGNVNGIKIENFKLTSEIIRIGNSTTFNLKIINKKYAAKFRIEYCVYYLKKNGSHSQKVFQIKETKLIENEKLELTKKISFKNLTTRKHYAGKHYLSLKINGNELAKISFDLN